jgi:uncharacterized sulfatase
MSNLSFPHQPVRHTLILLLVGTFCFCSQLPADERPNILWISCEDISPNLGCYGDAYAKTPHLDALAAEGVRFDRAFTHAGVCAVLRSGVITGVYPVSIGSQHMRSQIVPPPYIKCFTEYLRGAGYFCTNRSKTDYQFDSPSTAWDRQGNKHADWRERQKDQPFFSVINLTISHESQIRHGAKRHEEILKQLQPDQIHDPDLAAKFLPPYLPDTPASRQDWSYYCDNISEMDREAGEILAKLEADGLADNTLVVFWGDHGQGMPRGKRWIYDSGTQVPLIMRWPKNIDTSSVREDLVTLLDLPPTMLQLAGVTPPAYMHGRILLGPDTQQEPEFIFFHRDRMDETYELIRGARDRRFKYLRNFEPERTYSQHIEYMDEMPTMRDWRRLHQEGKLNADQSQWFAKTKPFEELFDTANDKYELQNLADKPEYQQQLARMRSAVEEWQIAVNDQGMIPEPILMSRMRPDGKMQVTADPTISLQQTAAGKFLQIVCETQGASIEYAFQHDDKPEFRLYTTPVPVTELQQVVARACRLGFQDSRNITATVDPAK